MDKIIVKHSSIVINNYELGDSRSLEYAFSVYDKLYHMSYLKILEYIEEEKKLIVPRGIDIHYLENLFGVTAKVDTKHDPYDIISEIKLKYMPRDDIQKEALAFMLGEKKYFHNKKVSQLSVNLNTGKGKTYVSIVTAAAERMRSMIITSSLDWLNQWKNCILEYTDTMPREIYMLIGSPSISRLLSRDPKEYKFILASHDTIKSYGDKYGWDKVGELFKHCKIGLKFYDEAHLNFDNMAKIDMYTNTFRTYYVTATPARSDSEENILFKYYFKNVPSINLFDENKDPHTAYIGMLFNSHPNATEISNCRNPYGFDKNKYSIYVTGKENYYNILHILINICIKNGMKNVFYIATNEAIKVTKDWIINNYPELESDIGVFTSIISQEEKELQLNKKIILSTTKSLGAAVDIKGLKVVVVLAEPFKSEVLARQTLGRTRDDDTFYIEVVDTGFDSIKRYYKDKKPIFEKYATSISEIKLDDYELEKRVEKCLRDRIIRLNLIPRNMIISFNRELVNPIFFIKEPIKPISFINGK